MLLLPQLTLSQARPPASGPRRDGLSLVGSKLELHYCLAECRSCAPRHERLGPHSGDRYSPAALLSACAGMPCKPSCTVRGEVALCR